MFPDAPIVHETLDGELSVEFWGMTIPVARNGGKLGIDVWSTGTKEFDGMAPLVAHVTATFGIAGDHYQNTLDVLEILDESDYYIS